MSHVMQQNTKKIDMSQVVKMAKQKSIDIFLTDTAMITAFALVITFTGLMFMKNTLTQSNSEKSVAWYVANIKEAQAKNIECRKDSSNTELQSTPDCVNALHAIEISFK